MTTDHSYASIPSSLSLSPLLHSRTPYTMSLDMLAISSPKAPPMQPWLYPRSSTPSEGNSNPLYLPPPLSPPPLSLSLPLSLPLVSICFEMAQYVMYQIGSQSSTTPWYWFGNPYLWVLMMKSYKKITSCIKIERVLTWEFCKKP